MEVTTAVLLLSLASMATPANDNVTKIGLHYNETAASGNSGYSAFYVSPTVSLVLRIATMIIAVVGCLANLYVLLALLLSKNSRASNINVFITHQTILDLTSCAFLFLSLVLEGVDYAELDPSLALFVCWFFGAHAITVAAGNASVCGLVIITIERYVKIVHSVAYRNRYRPWMTRAGIIIPWIFGILTNFVPTTARPYDKSCPRQMQQEPILRERVDSGGVGHSEVHHHLRGAVVRLCPRVLENPVGDSSSEEAGGAEPVSGNEQRSDGGTAEGKTHGDEYRQNDGPGRGEFRPLLRLHANLLDPHAFRHSTRAWFPLPALLGVLPQQPLSESVSDTGKRSR